MISGKSPSFVSSDGANAVAMVARGPRRPFFSRWDWAAFSVVFALAFLLYFHSLAPTVTLEDSGELIVAADYLGVPHPPGYPIWTLSAWLFRWLFRWVRFYGQPESNWSLLARSLRDLFSPAGPAGYPNPAFGVNLCSAFWGALACALLALLISRSGADLLRGLEGRASLAAIRAESWFAPLGGLVAGLLLACTPVLWSQSVIAEVYSLNAFFQTLVLVLLYRWMARPGETRTLYLLAFIFGLGLTNHQTLLFLGFAIAVGIGVHDRHLFRALTANAMVLVALVALNLWAARAGRSSWLWSEGPHAAPAAFWGQTAGALLAPWLLAAVLPRGRRAAVFIGLIYLGLSFYLYLPIASEQNPPMNWGYARTWSGFISVISRSQYERIRPADIFSLRYLLQLGAFWRDLQRQFSLPVAVMAAVPFLLLRRVSVATRNWLAATLLGFLGVSLVFLTFQNPRLDIHTLFVARVQFIQSHALWALWIGYGLLIALAWLNHRASRNRLALYGVAMLALSLPAAPLWQNARDVRLLQIYGGAEQNGHHFAWLFGHWQLDGWEAIRRDLSPSEWADYPTPGYPEPMAPGAILFGGTDPGRFVPTYLIFSAGIRPDIYLITQNALADHHYLQHLRDLYGDRIWIPSVVESQTAFQRYYDETVGKADASATLDAAGRMTVEGVGPVMRINSHLSHMIFHANLNREVYVEVSLPIEWMTPHLEPHGLIFRLRRERVTLTDEIVARDRAFWNWLTARLLADVRFRRDVMARKTFAGLRAAIAQVYAHHRRYADAEYALRQAIELHPLSLEGNFRLADLLVRQGRYADAHEVTSRYLAQDPLNESAAEYAERVREAVVALERLRVLEGKMEREPLALDEAIELTQLYWSFQRLEEFRAALYSLLAQTGFPARAYLWMARLAMEAQDRKAVEAALRRYLEADPSRTNIWLDLAATYLAGGAKAEALETLEAARRAGHAEAVRVALETDPRFAPLREK